MDDPAACDNLADIIDINCMSLDDGLLVASNPVGGVVISEDGLTGMRSRVPHEMEILVGFGFSLALHAAVLISVFLTMLFFIPAGIPNAGFITVSFVEADALGCGLKGGKGGPGGDSADTGALPAGSPPAESAAKAGETTPAEPSSTDDMLMRQPEISLESSLQNFVEPENPLPAQPKELDRREKKKIVCTRKSVTGPSPKRKAERAAASALPASPSPSESLSPGEGAILENGSVNRSDGEGMEGADPGANGGFPGGGTGSGRASGSGEFKAEQVDTPPAAIRKIDPEFPPEARRMGIAGRVVVRFLVKIDGTVSKASVVESVPTGIFERSALEAIVKWRFKPGRYKGNLVATWVLLPIQFRLTR